MFVLKRESTISFIRMKMAILTYFFGNHTLHSKTWMIMALVDISNIQHQRMGNLYFIYFSIQYSQKNHRYIPSFMRWFMESISFSNFSLKIDLSLTTSILDIIRIKQNAMLECIRRILWWKMREIGWKYGILCDIPHNLEYNSEMIKATMNDVRMRYVLSLREIKSGIPLLRFTEAVKRIYSIQHDREFLNK